MRENLLKTDIGIIIKAIVTIGIIDPGIIIKAIGIIDRETKLQIVTIGIIDPGIIIKAIGIIDRETKLQKNPIKFFYRSYFYDI